MKPRVPFKLFQSAAWFLVVLALACPGPVFSNPVAPVVTHGSANFVENGSRLTINQFSNRAIIDWQSFSIGVGDTTQFIQPGASSAVLNRVRGNAASLIDGRLLANGRVFLLNSNGILIGKSGYIDTAGFVASTLDIDDDEFLRGGDLHFRGSSTASVVNLGTIKASAGDVVLIGATVRNDGTIGAPRGRVGLAAGQDVILMARGDRRIKVRTGKGKIINRGVIEANIAELEARNGNVGALAIRNDGRIAATGVTKRGGRIFLSAKGGSKIRNTGRLQARAARSARARPRISVDAGEGAVEAGGTIDASNENGEGGFVAILGSEINIPMDTVIISDGETGGGEIYVGGGESGLNPDLGNATNVRIEAGAQISANAINSGNGGRAIVFAEDTLNFSGHISATGGQQSGDGGFIELSGQKQIFIDNLPGQVNLDAPAGRAGMLLLDPIDVTIDDGSGGGVSGTNITDEAINAFLNGNGSLTITTSAAGVESGDITINSGAYISWASENSLTFNADNDFQNDGIIDGSGDIDIVAFNDVRNNGPIDSLGDVFIDASNNVTLNDYIKGSNVFIGEIDLGDGVSMTVDTTIDLVDGDTRSSTGLLYNRGSDGVISLREAVIAANSDSLFNDIAFSASINGAPIGVTGAPGENLSETGDLDVKAGSQIRLLGNGRTNTIIQSDGFDRVFDVFPRAELELQSLTIRDGRVAQKKSGGLLFNEGTVIIWDSLLTGGIAGSGGAIYNYGDLTVNESLIEGNFATVFGGGILNLANLTINNSTISGNTATYGGGIENWANLTINNSTISRNGNDATVFGGGIENSGILEINNSTISGNTATNGGGIENWEDGNLTINNSTISENYATKLGGGIDNDGQLTIYDSTILDNFADIGGGINNAGDQTINNSDISGNDALFYGGGIHNDIPGNLTVNSSTISFNIADWGGGIDNEGVLTINNSTISGNYAIFGGGISNFTGQLTINNSDISGNFAEIGGGIDNFLGQLSINDSTISGNYAEFGGGISNFGDLTINESSVTDNFAESGGGIGNAGEMTINESTITGNTNETLDAEGINLVEGGETMMALEGDGSTGGMFPSVEFPNTSPPTLTPNQTRQFGTLSLSGGVASVNTGRALTRSTKPEVRAALDLAIGGNGVAPLSRTDGVTSIAGAVAAFQVPDLVSRVLESAYDYRAESELSLAMGGDGSFSLPKSASTVTMSFSAPPARRPLAEMIHRSLAPGRASGLSRALGSNGTVPVDSSNKATGVTPDDLLTDLGTHQSLDSNITGETENELAAALNGSF